MADVTLTENRPNLGVPRLRRGIRAISRSLALSLAAVVAGPPALAFAAGPSFRSPHSVATLLRHLSTPQVSQAYYVVTSGGSVIPFGDAGNFGSITSPAPTTSTGTTPGGSTPTSTSTQSGTAPVNTGTAPATPVVSSASTSDAKGYWLLTSGGAIFAFGDAITYGSIDTVAHGGHAVALIATPDSKGYLIVTSVGAVYAFGDAISYGSASSLALVQPIVTATATVDGKGYWLVAGDGGIFAYGDAVYYGSTGNIRLVRPVVGMASTTDSKGYWMVASDGGIFAYGDATYLGSTGAITLNSPVNSMAPTTDSKGYWMVASDGGIFSYGDAAFSGSAVGHLSGGDSVVGIVATQPYISGGSAAAQAAVKFALSQVGVPYVYGGAGPGGYDCSGLVMVSFQQAGVTLPRTAQAQYDATIPVPAGLPLLPGDLVFFGSSTSAVSHDGIYIGNGQMVDAPHTGANVRVEDYNWDDYVGATRAAP